MTYHQPGAAGTASDGFRTDPADHDFTPEQPEYGRRDVCAHCKREHLPQPPAGDGMNVLSLFAGIGGGRCA